MLESKLVHGNWHHFGLKAMSDPASLTLYAIVPCGGGQCKELELTTGARENGMDIKKRLEKACNIPVDDMELFVKNPSEGSSQKWLRDDATLESEQVEDSAVLTVGVHGTGSRSYEDDELPETAVEHSMARNGDTSYYFAHARRAELPEEHRIVSGGEPRSLGASGEQSEVSVGRPQRAIKSYAWGDEKEAVKLYVSAEAEEEALQAAGDGTQGQVEVDFEAKGLKLRVRAEKLDWILDLEPLYYEVVPSDCRFRVSAGKRITITLKKKEAYTWLKLLKPDA